MKIGAYYYPEQWPREQWERDFDNMADMGLQMVHMGEFAWFEMEPAPGDIRLDWLEQCVHLARDRKMDVVLCTPTAAPPMWLIQQHPEILPLDDAGRRMRFGGRRHYSPTAPALHEAARRITTALADRFAKEPAVVGWQIDNGYSGPGFFDQNEHAHAAFRKWLTARYKTIDALNAAWGCQFWNTYYRDFSQILLPPRRDWAYGNPHHVLDASRFWSSAYAHFNGLQVEILRKAFKKGRGKSHWPFVTTNFAGLRLDCNPGDMAPELSLMSWDQYAVRGDVRNPPDETFRLGNPSVIAMMHDLMASYHGRWGVMALQPGQIHSGTTPTLLYPGAVRLWLWTAFAHGAEFVMTYRYRQPRFGAEMFHQGLVGPDGKTPLPGGREFAQVIEEMNLLSPEKLAAAPAAHAVESRPAHSDEPPAPRAPAHPAPAHPAPREVGLLFDFEQLWWYSILPQTRRWDLQRFVRRWYGAVARLGIPVRIIQAGQPWPENLPMVIAPGLQMVAPALVKQFEDYASAGGHLLLTCRTALMDHNGHLWEGPTAAPILPLIGGMVEAYDGLPDEAVGHVEMDGQKYPWGVWGDLLYAEPETRVLARYADQFYAGGAAVIQKRHGKGTVTYCGVAGERSFIEALVERLIWPPAEPQTGRRKRWREDAEPPRPSLLPVTPLPNRVHMLSRGAYKVLLNYSMAAVDAPAGEGANFIIGTRHVEPAGVAVWEEG